VKVSVVTPSLDQARFLERTLASVAAQTGAPIEHLVFDGASTDGSVAILERFRPPVRWVSEKDSGQADAVNKGIAASTGEIIGWLNSDDVYYPGAVARARKYLETHADVDVVYGMANHIDADDHVIEPYPTEPFDFRRLRERAIICQPAAFFRRSVVERFGPLDATLRYCMDYEFWLRLAKGGAKFAYLEHRLAGSRLHDETKTIGSRVAVHAEINDMLKRTLGRVPRRWLVNYAYAKVEAEHGRDSPRMVKKLRAGAATLGAMVRWGSPFGR
jgi:glycosyltransferase involved in cell wall biosynthesis